MGDVWDPRQYERFAAEREAPFRDLLSLVRARPRHASALDRARLGSALDIGCGTGRLTQELHRELELRTTLGIDSSASMLAEATAYAGDGLAFERADVAAFEPERSFDLVFSNAALHWIDDQRACLHRIAGWIAPRGELAVQVPASSDHPSHVLAAELARDGPFASALGGFVRRSPVLAPEAYAELLFELGFAEQHVRLAVYPHVLASSDELVEWGKGTLLTAYRERFESRGRGELYATFVERYRDRLRERLGAGPLFFPFKRILLWARRP